MRPIDADALKEALIEKGIFPAVVKNAIDRAKTVTQEEFNTTRLQALGLRSLLDEDIYMCTMCTAKHSSVVRYCSYCGAFVTEVI